MRFAADTSRARSFYSVLRDDGVGSADADLGIGDVFVGRNREVGRRRTLPDAARGVVDRAVAGAEETVILALMRERNAAEMSADADQHQPLLLALLHACRI